MSEPVPAYAQEAYAILHTRFGIDNFPASYLSWFISNSMAKKTLHVLEHAGWIKRVKKAEYACVNTNDIFSFMIQLRVPELLKKVGKRYAYTDASAVEIWTDYSYIQRSWEHSPYYVSVLRKELKNWIEYFRRHRVRVFISEAQPSLGEFMILKPEKRLSYTIYGGLPVDPLETVVRYCEKHIDAFEFPLAYLKAKFGVKTRVVIDERVTETARMVA